MAVLRGGACKPSGAEGEVVAGAGCGCPAPTRRTHTDTTVGAGSLARQSLPGSEWQTDVETQWHEYPLPHRKLPSRRLHIVSMHVESLTGEFR